MEQWVSLERRGLEAGRGEAAAGRQSQGPGWASGGLWLEYQVLLDALTSIFQLWLQLCGAAHGPQLPHSRTSPGLQ